MNIKNHILAVALAAMPAATLQAQTYNDTVRTKTWSVFAGGGVSGAYGLRGVLNNGVSISTAPDVSVGVKYNIKPWVRVGATVGYTKLNSRNDNILKSTTTTNGFTIGDYNDGILTTERSQISDRHYQHLLGVDLNANFNILELWQKRNQQWNLWLGTGVGYMHGWDHSSLMTAINEEGISQGPDHFNVYNHSYITTQGTDHGTDALYVPARLSLEYDVTPQWTIGAKGELKYFPLKRALTPNGIWSANITIAYNFVCKEKRRCSGYHEPIALLNSTIDQLRSERDECGASRQNLTTELNSTKAELNRIKAQQKSLLSETSVFFDCDKTIITASELEKVATVAEQLKANPLAVVTAQGWASTEGPTSHNWQLAEKRASVVANMLRNEYGISADRISIKIGGPTDIMAPTYEPNRVVTLRVEK